MVPKEVEDFISVHGQQLPAPAAVSLPFRIGANEMAEPRTGDGPSGPGTMERAAVRMGPLRPPPGFVIGTMFDGCVAGRFALARGPHHRAAVRLPRPTARLWSGFRARSPQDAGDKGPAVSWRTAVRPGDGGPKAGIPSGARCSVWRGGPAGRGAEPRPAKVSPARLSVISRTWSRRS